jgi:hypothetical protein
LAAIITNKLSDSEAWMAALFFAAVGCLSWLAGRAPKREFLPEFESSPI